MFRKRIDTQAVLFGVFVSLVPITMALAQEPAPAAKLDTLVEGQKKILTKLDQIQREVEYLDPLAAKSLGIEFNPAYLLLASADEQLVLSGGFSLFQVDRRAEIAFPLYFRNSNKDGEDITTFVIDSQFRRFLGRHQGGFYLSGGVRYKYVQGKKDLDAIPFIDFQNGEEVTLHKFGLGFGLGYRYFSHSSLYWGTSLTVGRYFTGTDKVAHDDEASNGKAYIDIELLKFGLAF